ncbi:disease resistance protein RPM1-like [Cornus florida]|uniref:disease resistance protein RPM1-like n=1 Tax=Cornus florida TaxID=4283 RepID=UPI0028A0D08E|nr:disease resistance protein RPM1-like [Cornus florida]
MDSNDLKAEIKDFLQQRRYVLVFDDVWQIHAWDALKYAFPDNNSGSRILLTTRIVDVASTSCVESPDHIYTMEPLSQEESWTLFCRKTFQDNCCPPDLEKVSRSILEKCKGLPLAVVAVSGVLATKDRSTSHDWELFHRSLGAQSEGHDKLESMKKILSLSYYNLPYYLKICFLYLGLFPEDYKIERMRVIRLWIAEGFVEVRVGRTMEEVAEGYLKELINRSLVQVARIDGIGRLRECRIHDLFREVITSKSRQQNIAAMVSKESTTWPEKVRRLSIQYTLGNLQQTNRFPQLRSLLMFSVEEPISKSLNPILFSGGVRLLKVLDLRGASLEMLPDEILKLQRLRHLLVYNYNLDTCGFKAIVGIEGLSSLQILCFIEANHENGRIVMGELGRLTQLRRLGIRELRREDGKALCSSLEKLSNLQSLSVASVENKEIVDIQHLSSPRGSLQRLYLWGPLENLPHWITSLHNLVRLRLRYSKLRDDPLQSLQDLPNLLEIVLFKAYRGEEMCIKSTGFQKLKILELYSLEGLRWVRMEKGSLPHLEKLTIWNCELLEESKAQAPILSITHGMIVAVIHCYWKKQSLWALMKVYDNMEVKNHFKSHAWITVSQSFDLKELLKDLIQQLFNDVKKLKAPQRLESMDNNNLKAQLKDFLQPRSLDDVWSINAWDALKYITQQ